MQIFPLTGALPPEIVCRSMRTLAVQKPKNPRPPFRVEERQCDFSEQMFEHVVNLMTWNSQMALYDTLTPGRSLYVLAGYGTQEVLPVKIKGAGGIKTIENQGNRTACLVSPEPHRRYSPVRQPHFVLGPDYTMDVVLGSVKSMFSCSADACRNEYGLQQKAWNHGIAFPSLLHGSFQEETDLTGRQTGAVAIVADPEYRTVGQANYFDIVERDGKPYAIMMLGDRMMATPLEVMSGVRARIIGMMGTVKRALLVDAGIARHAGHEGNFLVSADRRRMVASDFDSAKDLATLDADMRAYQILRDVAHDTWRVLSKFALKFELRDEALGALAQKDCNPVYAFLRGFFGKTVSTDRIDAEAERLTQRFVDFARQNRQHVAASKQQATETNAAIAMSLSTKVFYPLFTDCVVACTALLRIDDDVRGRGFVLPEISESDLRVKADRGLEIFDRVVQEESDRAVDLMKKEGKDIHEYF